MNLIAACVIVALGPSISIAQAKPDFSGRWVVFATSSTGPGVPRELDVQHSREKGTLTVIRRTRGSTQTDSYALGSTAGAVVMGPRGPMTKALRTMAWDGSVLVISDMTSYNRDSDSGRHEAWSLGADGQLRIVITAWSPGNEPMTATVTYRKQTS